MHKKIRMHEYENKQQTHIRVSIPYFDENSVTNKYCLWRSINEACMTSEIKM